MTAGKPPAADSLGTPTGELQGMARDGQTLKAEKVPLGAWLDQVTQAADKLHAQIAVAQGLVINEGVVGSFTSAKMTAHNLNESAEAIRQRMTASAEFLGALKDFSTQAFNKLYAQDGH